MKKRIHEIISPIIFYHFIFSLITYLILGLIFNPTFVTKAWFIPNIMIVCIEIMMISVSRLLDKRYQLLKTKGI